MTSYETLTLSYDGDIAEIRLTRPDCLNRFDALAHEELLQATSELKASRSVRAVILSADGKVFSAGGDIDEVIALRQNPELRQKMFFEGKELIQNILDMSPPVIAAVQGDAIGLGASLVALCDLAVICKTASLIDPHVAIGLIAGDGGSLAWPHSVGMMRTKRYLLTGEPLAGDLAYEMGLVSHLVDTSSDVLPAAQKLAKKVASLAPAAVQGTKKALNKILKHRMEEMQEYAFLLEEKALLTDDGLEALEAWKEKRHPVFTGK